MCLCEGVRGRWEDWYNSHVWKWYQSNLMCFSRNYSFKSAGAWTLLSQTKNVPHLSSNLWLVLNNRKSWIPNKLIQTTFSKTVLIQFKSYSYSFKTRNKTLQQNWYWQDKCFWSSWCSGQIPTLIKNIWLQISLMSNPLQSHNHWAASEQRTKLSVVAVSGAEKSSV